MLSICFISRVSFITVKEMLINWRYDRITSLRGTRSLAYLIDMSRLLCSVRLVLHLVCRINQRFFK